MIEKYGADRDFILSDSPEKDVGDFEEGMIASYVYPN